MRILGLGVVVLLGSGCVAGNVAAGALLKPVRVPVVGTVSAPHEAFTVTTADGMVLDAWLLKPALPARGLVVLVHGKDINRQHFVGEARRFLARGVAVLAYDQRAHGRSSGEFVTYGAKEVPDLRLVLDTALERLGAPHLPVAVVGESLGAAVALQTAAVEPRIRAVVAGAAFADLETVIADHAPAGMSAQARRDAVAVAEREARFKVADISPERAARSITVPTLLLHGSEDSFLPMKHSLRIYSALAGPKRLVRLEGVGHVGVLVHDEAWDEVEAFLAPVFAAGTVAAKD